MVILQIVMYKVILGNILGYHQCIFLLLMSYRIIANHSYWLTDLFYQATEIP